ncbi:MAG: aldehyde ferredoxin oxidoreductase C-terminal domain-containing protein [Dehalococcoidia bacterium]
MASYGHAGQILYIDLTTREVRTEELRPELIEGYIGGWGINARLAYDLIPPGTDALAPAMPLIFGAGALTGTLSPSTPKSFLTTKCPASGTISTAVGSGYFGSMLKWAGYDHVVVTGRAEGPVYINIFDSEVEILDARSLWGRDLTEATDDLREKHGGIASILCIGPAGENGVKIGIALVDKCSTLGRSNAANLGSKNLKAIVVRGSRGIGVKDAGRFGTAVEGLRDAALSDPLRQKWMDLGLYLVYDTWAKAGFFIHHNQTEVFPAEEAVELYGTERFLKMRRSFIGCPSCLTPDKYLLEIKEGEFAGLVSPTSTSDAAALSFGIRGGAEDLNRAVKLFDDANRLGIDALTFSSLYDFTVDLFEKGILTKEDTGGLELKGGYEALSRMLHLTAERKGFGAVLAEGWLGAIEKIGRDCERYAYHIKGTEPDFDARISLGVETFGPVTSPRGAHDMPVGGITVAKGRNPDFFKKVMSTRGFTPEAMERIFVPPGFDLGRFVAHYDNWGILLNCLGICFRMQSSRLYDLETCAELFGAATGIEISPGELLKNAERAYNVYRAANAREGFGRRDDRFPRRWLEPLKQPDGTETVLMDYFGTKAVTADDVEGLLDNYYDEKGWDIKTGIPTREKLSELGLESVAGDLLL